ncbi:MAG: hypothetical protein K1060chlam5_00062 [Candidatus Anoxychlamydiales bacterium]|nr:hypothetical protein [Candidatus Anoxychlamydiales bacterium]
MKKNRSEINKLFKSIQDSLSFLKIDTGYTSDAGSTTSSIPAYE